MKFGVPYSTTKFPVQIFEISGPLLCPERMAWCGDNITLARVGASGHSQLARMGMQHHHYSCDVPGKEWGKILHTPQMWPLPFEVVQVAFSSGHFAVVTASGRLYTAGWNDWGQLGREDAKCSRAHELGPVPLPTPCAVETVACGERNTLVIFKNAAGGRSVYGCGSNFDQQLPGDAKTVWSMRPVSLQPFTGTGQPWAEHDVSVRVAVGQDFTVFAVGGTIGAMGTQAPGMPAGSRCTVFPGLLRDRVVDVKHLVAGDSHVLAAAVDNGLLRVWGWGHNRWCQLGFQDGSQVLSTPTEIVFGCPKLPSNDFPSMLAAWDLNSVIMVNGNVWTFGRHDERYSTFAQRRVLDDATCRVQQIDPVHFDNLPVAHVSVGLRHAAFVTTCGRLYVRGFSGKSKEIYNGNGLPTSFRESRRGVVGICRQYVLRDPALVPSKLLGDCECGVTRMCNAKKLAFFMATHRRLGSVSALAHIDCSVLKMMLEFADALLPSLACP